MRLSRERRRRGWPRGAAGRWAAPRGRLLGVSSAAGAPKTAMTASPTNFSDRPAGALDLGGHRVVETLEQDADALRIAIAGVGGRADEVGEQDRDQLALFARAHGRSLASGRVRRYWSPSNAPSASSQTPSASWSSPSTIRERAENADAVPVHAGLEQDQSPLERLVDDGRRQLQAPDP